MRTMKQALSLALATASLALAGCASIVGDTNYPVAVTSAPNNAHFEVRNEKGMLVQSGNTPSTIILPSSDGFFDGETYSIKYTMAGHDDHTVTLDSTVSGWYWANIAIGGLVGMLIVDPATGAMYKLPENVSGNLSETAAATGKNAPALNVISVTSLSEIQRSQLVEIK